MSKEIRLSGPLEKAKGEIEVTLANDMMFHMVMSRSERALKGLVCALKGLDPGDVRSVKLLNTIDYGEYIEKEIILDTMVEMK